MTLFKKNDPMRTLLFSLLAAFTTSATAQDLADAPPTNPEAEQLYQEGEKAYNAGAIAKAIGFFTQALEKDPDHLNAYLQRGFCFTMQREYQRAVQDFTAVIERKSDHLWAYTSRGSAYAKLNKHELAIRDFNRVLELDPRNEEAYNNRGWSKKATGDVKGGCADWKASKKMGNAEAKIILRNNRCQ